jgi:hypothetical protein
MSTAADAGDVHPLALVTVNVCVPAGRPVTVYVVPVPEISVPPVFRLRVHVPVAGKPLRATLPVETEQVAWVIVPTTGAEGSGLTVTAVTAEGRLWQPLASVTLTE